MVFRQTIDSVVADISRKVQKLHQIAEAADSAAEYHLAIASLHQNQRSVAITEAARARTLAGRFHALVS